MKLGVHCSIAGGVSNALLEAQSLGCDTMQIFSSAPKIWKPLPYSDKEINKYLLLNKKLKISPVFIHSIYLVTLASHNIYFYNQSKIQLIDGLKKVLKIGAAGVVTHLGSAVVLSQEQAIDKVVEAIGEVLKTTSFGDFIIENSAGAGKIIGDRFDEIGEIIARVKNNSRLKVALDTAHAYGAGYDLASEQGLEETLGEFDDKIGLDRLVLIHANDTKVELASNLDRHANIGEGKIGIEGFKRIFNHPKLSHLPFILETPGFKTKEKNKENLDNIRKLTQ